MPNARFYPALVNGSGADKFLNVPTLAVEARRLSEITELFRILDIPLGDGVTVAQQTLNLFV